MLKYEFVRKIELVGMTKSVLQSVLELGDFNRPFQCVYM